MFINLMRYIDTYAWIGSRISIDYEMRDLLLINKVVSSNIVLALFGTLLMGSGSCSSVTFSVYVNKWS